MFKKLFTRLMKFFKKIQNISIIYKVNIPLVLIIIAGILIIAINSYFSLQKIEKKAIEDIEKEFRLYVEKDLSKRFQVCLTNAINISLNQKVIDSLKNKDRELAKKVLKQIVDNINKYSNLDNVKIHIHDKNVKSFLRSWVHDRYGDNLKKFRYSLTFVNKNKKPIVEIENGRVGMVIRGIAPIFDEGEFLGSVEFIQDFNSLILNAKKIKNYSVIVLNNETGNEEVDKFNKDYVLSASGMTLSQAYSITDEKFYKAMDKGFDKDSLKKNGLLRIGDYYVSSVSIHNVNEKEVGCILIGADKEYVNRYVDQVKETLTQHIWILVGTAIVMLILLVFLLNITVSKPIFKLLRGLKQIDGDINNGMTSCEVYNKSRLKYRYHDEIGVISYTINVLLRSMSKTFIELQKSQKHTAEYISAIHAGGGLVSTSDIDGYITYVNDELCRVSGYTREELIGKPYSIFKDPDTSKEVYAELWRVIQSGKTYTNMLKNKKKDGSFFYANTKIIPITDDKDKIIEYIAFRDDVTELINSKEELKTTFLKDPMTNLGNRLKMLSDVNDDSYLAIFDVNFFREINDFYGYKVGDMVLKDLARRMCEHFCDNEIEVYHLNADEFGVMASRKSITQSRFFELLKDFLDINKNSELLLDEQTQIIIRLTCGVSYDSDNLVNFTDIAHKHAKKINKDILEYTNDINMDEEYKKNLEWTSELKKAIDEDRIKAYFQPIVNAKTSKIEKYETLMRLIKSNGEEVSPIYFLDIAKKTRIYKELTKIIVKQAFEKFSSLEYEFSINLSVEDILFHDVSSWFFDLALEKGVQNQLVIELVESEGIESFDLMNEFIQKAKEHGMKIAIDDFGTGYSNFEYLIKLNANYLKIDGSLIREIDKDEKIYGVVESIVAFAKKNNIKVIAEFVSTQEIYEKIQELNIDFGQGFYLGKPLGELV